MLLSLFQGFFLFAAGKLIFDMGWGPQPLWLDPGDLRDDIVRGHRSGDARRRARPDGDAGGDLRLDAGAGAGRILSGCLMGDRALMPDQMQTLEPHHAARLGPGCVSSPVADDGDAGHDDRRHKPAALIDGLSAAGFLRMLAWWRLRS